MMSVPELEDVTLGRIIRLQRTRRKMSQGDLARAIGVTYQQVQKYEHGENRIGYSRLVKIARALSCPLLGLIEQCEGQKAARTGDMPDLPAELTTPGATDLLANFAAIHTAGQRRAVLEITAQFAGTATRAESEAA